MNTNPSGTRPGEPRTVVAQSVPPPLPPGTIRTVTVSQGPVQPQPEQPADPTYLSTLARIGKVAAYTIIPVIMLASMAIGILYVRLRHGPIGFGFMVPPIERGINAELSNNSVKIEGAELYLTETGAFEFRLRQLTVYDNDGDAIGGSPLAAVNISTAALWRLRVVPARVELIDPEINLVYTDADGLALDEVVRGPVPARRPGASGPRQERLNPEPEPENSTAVKLPPRPVNIARMLSESSQRARKRQGSASYLVEFGLRNATINLAYAGKKTTWTVPEASVDFDHARRRSVISGRANVASPRGPWAISFVTDETEKTDKLEVKATVRDLVPSTLAGAAPPLALLQMIDLPIAGDATVQLSTNGDIESSQIAIEAGAGRIMHPALSQPFNLTAALLSLKYEGRGRTWTLAPSPVKWPDGSVLFSGTANDAAGEKGPPQWSYAIEGRNGVLEATEFALPAIPLSVLSMAGTVIPRRGRFEISEAHITGGGGDVTLSAISEPGASGQNTDAKLTFSAMPLETFKVMWPRTMAPGARSWVGQRVTAAAIKGGNVSFRTGDFLAGEAPAAGASGERLSAAFEVADVSFIPLDGMSPIVAPRALIRLENNALEVSVPEAAVVLPGNRKVPIKAGRLVAADVMSPRPESEITFSTQSQLGPFLETIETIPIRAVSEAAPFPKAGEGKVDAQMKVKLPLISKLSADDVVLDAEFFR